ncbi:MRG-domain-containing protein [Mrakia frigida]|uniref:Eaf3p n=1 Tax=Mrakia frigida TaxID=29902 RepID=UPI003FCC0D12
MSQTWSVGERVLCFHGPLLYEAKLLKAMERESSVKGVMEMQYWVHYKGWKQSWDEYVPGSRLFKLNEESLAKQKGLVDAAPGPSTKASGSSHPIASGSGGGRNKGREEMISGSSHGPRKRAREGESEGDYMRRPEVKIPIPEVLKVQLVDDWEAVTKNNQIVILPRTPTVAELIQQYKAYAIDRIHNPSANPSSSSHRYHVSSSRRADATKSIAILTEVLSGLQLYFDRSLGANLLYRFERPQYVEQRRQHQEAAGGSGSGELFEASKIYGAEHLLRLFVNLPSFIAHTSMDAESVSLLREHIVDFMKYMVKEQKRIFMPEYELATATYINQSRA